MARRQARLIHQPRHRPWLPLLAPPLAPPREPLGSRGCATGCAGAVTLRAPAEGLPIDHLLTPPSTACSEQYGRRLAANSACMTRLLIGCCLERVAWSRHLQGGLASVGLFRLIRHRAFAYRRRRAVLQVVCQVKSGLLVRFQVAHLHHVSGKRSMCLPPGRRPAAAST